MLQRLLKPWYVYQPWRILRRLFAPVPQCTVLPLRTSWGGLLSVDPSRDIGNCIFTTGIYDLTVTETLLRLISPGATVVDAGAHVGYMTILAAIAAGPGGKVVAFEPNPQLFTWLQQNVRRNSVIGCLAEITLHQAALGESSGQALLEIPPPSRTNDGLARIGVGDPPDVQSIPVPVFALDDLLDNATVQVLKLDVEGHEPYVLRGAAKALRERRIEQVVFEDHGIESSETVQLLHRAGYSIFALGWSLRGPRIGSLDGPRLAAAYEAPSYLATLIPEVSLSRLRPRGWLAFRDQRKRRKRGGLP